jgi:hypothetical protein
MGCGGSGCSCGDCDAGYDPNDYGDPYEPFIDAEKHANLNAIADLIAARMELAVVQRVPRDFLEWLEDNIQGRVELPYLARPPSQVCLRYVRRGNVLELAFEVNGGNTVARFRFEPS